MGNCGSICSRNISKYYNEDIIMENLINKNNETKYALKDNINKIIFLQKNIKFYIRRKKNHKSNHSSTKQTGSYLAVHHYYNSHSKNSSSKSQNFKNYSSYKESNYTKSNKNDSSPKNRSPKNRSPKNRSPKNKSRKNRSPKNRSPKNRNKITSFTSKSKIEGNDNNEYNCIKEIEICKNYNNEQNGDNGIIIPPIKPDILEKEIFNKDPFRMGIRNTNNENDPRDAPNDNIRKKYPKIIEDQSSYLGEWKNGKRDGLGLLIWENQSKFFGNFIENNVTGYGQLWHQNGNSYKGQWKDFQAEGWGIYNTQKGEFFQGQWSGDKQDGFGVEGNNVGNIFLGEYNMGNKNGIGILNFESKAWYEGEFKNGAISGIGTFFFEDGTSYQGMWNNNKMEGYGYIIWPDENYYKGEFKEDKKEGFGICKIGKKIFMGMWKNNKLEGKVIIIEDENYKKQFWQNGKGVRNLPIDTQIFFQKYAEEYIKAAKNNKPKKTENE